MKFFSKLVIWMVLSLFAVFGARADDGPRRDVLAAKLLICGTAEKAQRFAADHRDLAAALAGAEKGGATDTCLMASIAYVAGKPLRRVRASDQSYDVTEITIVGVATPFGFIAVPPSVVYTLVKVEEQAA